MKLPWMNPPTRVYAASAFCFILSACQSTAPIASSDLATLTPSSWTEAAGNASSLGWVASFESPDLTALVEEADKNNLGLEAAFQRTRATEAATRISRSLRLPSFGANYRASRSESLISQSPPNSIESETHSLNLSARWEIDVWNRLGQDQNAAQAQSLASKYDFESFRLSLAGQVARAWFNAIEAKTQFDLASSSAESFEINLTSLEKRYARGLANAFDLRLIRAQASSSRANALRRKTELDRTLRNLETLLGRYPSAELLTTTQLPELAAIPAAGLPSELLARRPDLLAQKNRLLSALALKKSIQRNWLPSLTLTASDGTLSSSFSNLIDSDFNVWSLAGDVSMALFQSGRLKAQRDQLNANQLAQLAQYKDLVLNAFREVETSLRGESNLRDLEAQTRSAADENRSAENQAWQLYERGLVDITSVLEAERRSFETRSQLISIRNLRLQNRIALHIALGGDL